MITWCFSSLILCLLVVLTLGADNNSFNGAKESFLHSNEGIKYHNYEDITKLFKELTVRYPRLARLHTVGKSVEGREMWVLEISENVANRSIGEPMFKFVANMHGDETIGRQLMVYLSQFLLENYGTNARITKLVNNTDLFLMPSMNPDGFEHSVEGHCESLANYTGRQNINNVDLNRDFPDQFDRMPEGRSQDYYANGRQMETLAIMSWVSSEPFVLSGNLHAGAVVASYPFDNSGRRGEECCVDAPTPDDSVFRELATVYAKNHKTMHKGSQCKEDHFPGGVTNGAFWYNVRGGMQDYNYLHSNCFEVTFELSCCKYPPSLDLPQEWSNNREALFAFMEATHWGVKGVVHSSLDGTGVPGARISVRGISHNVTTSKRGEFWRLLLPGQYEIQASAPGFIPSKAVITTVTTDGPTKLDFTLQPAPLSPEHQHSTSATSADLLKPSARLEVVEAPPRDIHGFPIPVKFEHHDYEAMERELRIVSQNFPNITRLYSAGRSVQSRELFVLEISDHPGVHEPGEPEVKLVANQHGNEVVGREMLLLLAKWLVQNYHSDPRAGHIVNNTRLHLMPSMNPDGYHMSSQNDSTDMVGRTNSHDKDLNRNFPDQYKTNDYNRQAEPETVAIMAWTQSLPFILSANLHGGSLVANYPFDDNAPGQAKGQENPSPDDAVFKHLANTFARKHPLMHQGAPCKLRTDENFSQGIVNGAAWYPVVGGMQDWNYVRADCFELTIELGCQKFPPAIELPKYWEENREALLSYVEQAQIGVQGFVLDPSNNPIAGSYIKVDGIDHLTRVARDGDYWRLLTAGQYYMTATAVGYDRATALVTVPEVSLGQPGKVTVNFTISPERAYTWSNVHDFGLEGSVRPQANYSNDAELTAAMGELENQFPGMAELEAGVSDVSMLIHSLKVQKESGSPDEGKIRILFLGGLRASQPMGRELLLRLANHVITGASKKDPSMVSVLQRATLLFAPGIDRSFHLVDNNCHAAPSDLEVESKFVKGSRDAVSEALRKLIKEFEADLVINVAGGAYSVSVPNSASSTELELFLSLKRAFSNKHPVLSKTQTLCDTTNHTGSTFEDYIFKEFGIPAVTVRVGCCCYPSIAEVAPLWQDNMQPFVNLMMSSLQGVEGQIVDKYGTPIRSAHIKMARGSQLRVAFTENGARFRVLLPVGTHRLSVWAEGFEGREISAEVTKGVLSLMQVRLEPEGSVQGEHYLSLAQNKIWMESMQKNYSNLFRVLPLSTGVSVLEVGVSYPSDTTPTVAIVLDHPEENNCIAREVAVKFVEHLVMRFESDELATRMLKSSKIVILPIPTETTGMTWSVTDTAAWLHDKGPVITVVLSSGALGVALPSSVVLGPTPDRHVLLQMASSYVKNNVVMKLRPLPLVKDCVQTDAEGASWDAKPGGLLDESYNSSSTLPLSVYLCCERTPPPTEITRIWRENREAMLALLGEDLHRGVTGFVLDDFSGAPIPDAILLVDTDSNGAPHHQFHTRPNSGAFWRPLSLGEHAITAQAPGYMKSTKLVQVTTANKHENLVFRLAQDDRIFGVPKMAVIMSVSLLFISAITCALLWYAIKNHFKRRPSKDAYSFQVLRTSEYDQDYDYDDEPEVPVKNGTGVLLDRAYRSRPYRDDSSSDDEVDVLVRAGRDDIIINGNLTP